MDQGDSSAAVDHRKGNYVPIRDTEDPQLGLFDKPLPCCGCGLGWCSFLLGFLFPVTWYFAAVLYFGKYYHKDPRERSGLAACAIAVSVFYLVDYCFAACFHHIYSFCMYIGCVDHCARYFLVILATTGPPFHPPAVPVSTELDTTHGNWLRLKEPSSKRLYKYNVNALEVQAMRSA
ncbi:hypothetical protein Tsubulata_018467 [Turnera subulata]|uniref:60S ribosomal protein L18a-like protein n=1 Tax=Turnera subulata TaxID=218843 RepID=A0A9Q0FS74_9ROSI|nr:hypothetical protein Tsubulata_018467 [Turnera subulata]